MNNKPTEKTGTNTAQISTPPEPVPSPTKRKLTLDIDDVSDVLERKISPDDPPVFC